MKFPYKAVVFDLDGTLYEETEHFQYYASKLRNRLPDSKQNQYEKEVNQAFERKHAIQIGRIYDAERDLVLVQKKGKITEAYRFDGQSLSEKEFDLFYNEISSFQGRPYYYIGDLWYVPVTMAIHYGLTGEEVHDAFLETREFMMGPHFKMKVINELQELLYKWKDEVVFAVLTNSPEPDSETILKKLAISDVFTKKIFNGKKPFMTEEHFKRIKNEFGIPFSEMISIGDNFVNDIIPPKDLGCTTIYVDPFHLAEKGDAHYIIRNTREITPILRKLLLKD